MCDLSECVLLLSFFFLQRFYLFIHERHRETGRGTGRGRRSRLKSGSRCGNRSWDSRITPWAKGRHQTAEPPRDPSYCFLICSWLKKTRIYLSFQIRPNWQTVEVKLNFVKNNLKEEHITLSAQEYIKNLYSSLGFNEISDIYDECNIPHVKMRL